MIKTSSTSLLRLVLSCTTLLALYNLGPAPIRADKYNLAPHTNLQPQDEKALESQQAHQVQIGQVGSVVAPKSERQMDQDSGSSDANSVLAAANRDGKHPDQAANQVLNAANQRLQTEGSGHSWLWAILLVGGALAGVFGIKRWADNNVPNAPITTPKKSDSW